MHSPIISVNSILVIFLTQNEFKAKGKRDWICEM